MLSKIAVKRPITTLMLILIVIGLGFVSLTNLQLDILPDVDVPVVFVNTNYPGASPSEMEQLVTKPLESAIGTVGNVKTISSQSAKGSSVIVVQFENGTDINNAALDVREKISIVEPSLPEDATTPMVVKADPNAQPTVIFDVSSDELNMVELTALVNDEIVPRLEKQNGVASVSTVGGLEKQIEITLIPEKMRGYGITEQQVLSVIATENKNTPVGSVKQGSTDLSVTVSGEYSSLTDIENLPITTPTGLVIPLSEIATVEEVYKEQTSIAYSNGAPCISIVVQKSSTGNVVEVSNAVLAELDEIQQDYPSLNMNIVIDSAEFVRATLSSIAKEAFIGSLFAVLVLLLFLRSVRSTIIVALAIPISVIATFILMYYADISLNVMSMGGLALGIGMLVDNSIVVLENIYRKIELGEDRKIAAIEGAKEVSLSVTASTLTTVAVFLPVTFVKGTISDMFTELALAVAFSLFSSLLISLTFVPMASSILLKPEDPEKKKSIFYIPLDLFNSLIVLVEKLYFLALNFVLVNTKKTLLLAFGLVVITAFSLSFISIEFLPATDEGVITITINTPKGTVLEETNKVTQEVLTIIDENPYIENVSYSIGSTSIPGIGSPVSSKGTITLQLVPKEERPYTSAQIATQLDESFKEIPGADITVSGAGSSLGTYSGATVDMYIYGDDLETLITTVDEVAILVEALPSVSDVSTSVGDTTTEARIVVDRSKASSYGISSATITSTIKNELSGTVVTEYKTNGTEYDVFVQEETNDINYVNDLNNILIPSPTGVSVPLSELATIEYTTLPMAITRENQEKYVKVTATVAEGYTTGDVTKDISNAMSTYILPDTCRWEFSGASQEMISAFKSLTLALIGAILLVYMIMAAEFESFIYPLIVMFSIPIALTGGLFGLFVTNNSLSITSFLGLIILSGIVINNAIVLIDYTKQLVEIEGMEVKEALLKAGPTRLRPILMSSSTTILGLLPIMLSKSSGSELMVGLAVVVVFGLTISTFITLLLIPTVYVVIDNIKIKFINKKNKKSYS